MKQLIVVPYGWPCALGECPPGLFMYEETLGFNNEYGGDPPYIVESGEVFWGGATLDKERRKLTVQPCILEWSECDD